MSDSAASAPRYWTVEEANAALPRVTDVVEKARAAVDAVRDQAATVDRVAGGNGHAQVGVTGALSRAVEALAAESIVLRDPDQGLIDFPAIAPSGRVYWLCWLVGEPAVEWWHWPEDGFAGRTPLTDPPD